MRDLPKNWAVTEADSIADVFLGKTPGKSDYASDGRTKVVKFRDLKNGYIDFSNSKLGFLSKNCALDSTFRELKICDVLITSAAHSGENIGKKCVYVQSLPDIFERIIFTGELLNIRSQLKELSKWIYYYFLSSDGFLELQKAVKGVHLTSGRAKKMLIPVAPINEQRRIVAKLDQQLPKVRLCEERLEKVTVIMKRFRQSVLAAACSGKLTADWRKEKKIDPNWKAIKLGSLISMLDQGWSPKCKINNSPSDSIWGVIKTTAVQPMKFDESENKELPDALSPKPHFEIQVDDLLITRAGPRVRAGVCCLVRSTRPKLMICDKVYRFRVIKQETLPQFIECALNNPLMVEYIDTLKTGISDSGLNLTQEKFRDIEIELPSLNEQNEIVRRVESLFKIADEIESRYQKAKVNIEKLTQSILAKAFRGELVAQDPNDEPASVLLERIRAEKSTHSAKPPKKKKGKMYKTRPSEREVVNG